eukprot:5740601-Amphidinium_carterae.1
MISSLFLLIVIVISLSSSSSSAASSAGCIGSFCPGILHDQLSQHPDCVVTVSVDAKRCRTLTGYCVGHDYHVVTVIVTIVANGPFNVANDVDRGGPTGVSEQVSLGADWHD